MNKKSRTFVRPWYRSQILLLAGCTSAEPGYSYICICYILLFLANSTNYFWHHYPLNKMWGIYTGMKPYYVGAYGFIIWRKDLQKFKSELIYIGNLKILDNIDKNGNGGVNASSWPFLQSFFNDQIKVTLNGRGQKTFKVTSILSE